jgi:hypothetical protein
MEYKYKIQCDNSIKRKCDNEEKQPHATRYKPHAKYKKQLNLRATCSA